MSRNCRAVLFWCALIATSLVQGHALPAQADGILDLAIPALPYVTDPSLQVVDRSVVFMDHDRKARKSTLMMLDLATRRPVVLQDGLPVSILLAATPKYVVWQSSEFDRQLHLLDRSSGRQATLCCFGRGDVFVDGDSLRLVERTNAGLSVTTIDLRRQDERKVAVLKERGYPLSWNGQLLVLGRELHVFDRNLVLQNTIGLPKPRARSNLSCQIGSAVIRQDRLVYVSNCGQINIFDLSKMRLQQTMPYFSESLSYHLAIADGLVFVAPNSGSDNVAVFGLDDGRALATLPISADALFAADGQLIVMAGNADNQPDLRIYDYAAATFRDDRRAIDEIVQRCREAEKKLAAGAAVQEALDHVESGTVAPLQYALERQDARDHLRPNELWAATFYARLLARTVDRIAEGVSLLELLHDLVPADRKIAAYAVAARARMTSDGLDVTPNHGDSVLSRLLLPGTGAQELTIGDGTPGYFLNLTIIDQQIYATQNSVGAGIACGTIAIYGRRAFDLRRLVPVVGCDDEFQDEITGVAVLNGRLYAAIQYRYEQSGRPDLIALDPEDGSVGKREQRLGGISQLVAVPGGLIACAPMGQCRLFDPLEQKGSVEANPTFCRDAGAGFPPTLAAQDIVTAQKWGGISNCDSRHVAYQAKKGEGTSLTFYALSDPQHSIASVDASQWPNVTLMSDRALIVDASIGLTRFRSINLDDGSVRSELSLARDADVNVSWAIDGELLFVGRGRDLILYDMKRGFIMGNWKNLISASTNDHGNRRYHYIASLVLDAPNDRLIVQTVDGHFSRLLPLSALRRALTDGPSRWQDMEKVLASED